MKKIEKSILITSLFMLSIGCISCEKQKFLIELNPMNDSDWKDTLKNYDGSNFSFFVEQKYEEHNLITRSVDVKLENKEKLYEHFYREPLDIPGSANEVSSIYTKINQEYITFSSTDEKRWIKDNHENDSLELNTIVKKYQNYIKEYLFNPISNLFNSFTFDAINNQYIAENLVLNLKDYFNGQNTKDYNVTIQFDENKMVSYVKTETIIDSYLPITQTMILSQIGKTSFAVPSQFYDDVKGKTYLFKNIKVYNAYGELTSKEDQGGKYSTYVQEMNENNKGKTITFLDDGSVFGNLDLGSGSFTDLKENNSTDAYYYSYGKDVLPNSIKIYQKSHELSFYYTGLSGHSIDGILNLKETILDEEEHMFPTSYHYEYQFELVN